jgi:amidohydrolase
VDVDEAKSEVNRRVHQLAGQLIAASHAIHARPELRYEEHFASATLAELLRSNGLNVDHPAYGMDTAFVARAGSSGPNVVICCEYDALPTIGHGCGHNIIGTAGVGAGLAAAALAEALGGRLTILGTPAEEGGGGKIRLLDAGAFDGADVAMMIHPEPANVEYVPYLANDSLVVEMHGKSAHASSSPAAGVNALDALVLGYQAVHVLRHRLSPDQKVFGIITHGGEADNVIPAFAAARYRIRARTSARLDDVRRQVTACFEGAAAQLGANCRVHSEGGYRDLRANRPLAAAFRRNAERLGRSFLDPSLVPVELAGSTDMGDVSYVVPTIHPVLDVGTLCGGHTIEMTAAAVTPAADQCVIDGAISLAMTAVDVWTDAALLAAVRDDFDRRRRDAVGQRE